MVFDAASGQLILFGGFSAAGTVVVRYADTWLWDGSNWTELHPVTPPPGRDGAVVAYDPTTGQVVMFGGQTDGPDLGDTWIWDGSNWTELHPAHSPPARRYASIAYDAATSQMVLVGGFGSQGALDDTWIWTGTDWSNANPQTTPRVDGGASMAFDSNANQLVLFGWQIRLRQRSVSWLWDGATWTRMASSPARVAPGLSYDPGLSGILLFGGGEAGPLNGQFAVRSGTMIWDGSQWSLLSESIHPQGRLYPATAYDDATGQLVMFGGINRMFRYLGDTWIYGA